MLAFTALFFPALITVCIYEHLMKTRLSVKNTVYLYAVGNIAVNCICAVIKKYIFKTADMSLLSGWDMTPSTALNYMIIAVPSAVLLAFFAVLLKKNVKVTKE
ncbi:MAG: hypothetical protein U0L66_07150 [Acutalibacteraceae bacterium]|nr:hypothetical protein [Acutalibacteraceae bacterium]